MADETPVAPTEDSRRWRMLLLLSIATLFSLTVWFSTNAIAPALEAEKGFSEGDIAWLTIGVQLGFVFGTLIISATNLADLINTRTLFAFSAILAGTANAALALIPGGLVEAMALRVLAGIALGGVYPPGIKIISGWFRSGRGLAIGVMIAALTLGSGSPHLLRAVFIAKWEATILISSILAVAGGAIVYLLVRDGPHDVPASRFNPMYVVSILKNRATRLVLAGYLGHMWELYAMWAWLPSFLVATYGAKKLGDSAIDQASIVAFLVFASGAIGSVAAGYLAERWGRTLVTSVAMTLSGGTALYIGFLPLEWGWLIAVVALFWGATVIADSAQFSTAMTELCEEAYRGTALTFQTGMGFLLTIATIRLVPVLSDLANWGTAFAFLSVGPIVGTIVMLRLRRLPEARALAMGKR